MTAIPQRRSSSLAAALSNPISVIALGIMVALNPALPEGVWTLPNLVSNT